MLSRSGSLRSNHAQLAASSRESVSATADGAGGSDTGAPLPQAEIDYGYPPELQGFLSDWAETHPDRVTPRSTT